MTTALQHTIRAFPPLPSAPAAEAELPAFSALGVQVTNASMREAIALMESWIVSPTAQSRAVFIVNAHTLNLAWDDPAYRAVLNGADVVFGDGTGVRLAASLKGVQVRSNLVGTDLLPLFVRAKRRRGYRYFLLGGTPGTPERACAQLRRDVPGVAIAGCHHGYVDADRSPAVIRMINDARPDMLLVAMGNPRQERWIHRHRSELRVPVSVGVGGLFDHWAGNLRRAPIHVRRLGLEWAQLLLQQPYKWRRYLVGNPKFVQRAIIDALGTRRHNGDGRAC